MIYGFAGAAIGGFALTAVATWTKRPPISGLALVILSALWLIARLLFVLPFASLLAPAIAADLGYGVLLFLLMSREVIAVRSQRNYKVLLILGLLPVTNGLFLLGMTRNNWMKRQLMEQKREPVTLPPLFDRFDLFTTWLMVAFAILHVLGAPSRWTAVVGLITSVLLFIRLTRWQGIHTGGEPLVWVLHLAFSWLPLAFLFLAFAELGMLPQSAGIHALTSGAITTMIIAIAGRAALGHTSRPLESHPVLTAAVTATIGPGARALLALSAGAWFFGFVCFAWRYVPILTQGRVQRPGALPTL
jgi:uncharacterized protein involved in response to NO